MGGAGDGDWYVVHRFSGGELRGTVSLNDFRKSMRYVVEVYEYFSRVDAPEVIVFPGGTVSTAESITRGHWAELGSNAQGEISKNQGRLNALSKRIQVLTKGANALDAMPSTLGGLGKLRTSDGWVNKRRDIQRLSIQAFPDTPAPFIDEFLRHLGHLDEFLPHYRQHVARDFDQISIQLMTAVESAVRERSGARYALLLSRYFLADPAVPRSLKAYERSVERGYLSAVAALVSGDPEQVARAGESLGRTASVLLRDVLPGALRAAANVGPSSSAASNLVALDHACLARWALHAACCADLLRTWAKGGFSMMKPIASNASRLQSAPLTLFSRPGWAPAVSNWQGVGSLAGWVETPVRKEAAAAWVCRLRDTDIHVRFNRDPRPAGLAAGSLIQVRGAYTDGYFDVAPVCVSPHAARDLTDLVESFTHSVFSAGASNTRLVVAWLETAKAGPALEVGSQTWMG